MCLSNWCVAHESLLTTVCFSVWNTENAPCWGWFLLDYCIQTFSVMVWTWTTVWLCSVIQCQMLLPLAPTESSFIPRLQRDNYIVCSVGCQWCKLTEQSGYHGHVYTSSAKLQTHMYCTCLYFHFTPVPPTQHPIRLSLLISPDFVTWGQGRWLELTSLGTSTTRTMSTFLVSSIWYTKVSLFVMDNSAVCPLKTSPSVRSQWQVIF